MLSTFKHTINYFLSYFSVQVLAFISIPVLTRLLTPIDYGKVKVFSSFVAVGTFLLPLCAYTAVGRYYYEGKEDFKDFFGTMFFLSASIFGITTAILLLGHKIFCSLLNTSLDIYICIFPICLTNIVFYIYFQVKQAQEKSKELAIVEVLRAWVYFGLIFLILPFISTRKYMVPIIAQLAAGIIFLAYMVKKLKPFFKKAFNRAHVKYISSYSLPQIPACLSGVLLSQADLIMINYYKGPNDAGLYAFAYTMGMFLWMFISAFYKAWMPTFFKYAKDKDYVSHDHDVAILMRIFIFAAICIVYFGEDAGRILAGSDFSHALPLIPVITISYLFWGIHDFFKNHMVFSKSMGLLAVEDVMAATINVVLNIIYIPKYGYVAGAYTTAISFGFMLLYVWVVNKFYLKQYSTPLRVISKPIIIFIIFILIYYLLYHLQYFQFAALLILRIILISAVFSLIFWKHRNDIINFFSQYMRIGVPKAHA